MTDALVEAVRSAMTSYLLENVSPDTVRAALQAIEAAGYRVVPVEATFLMTDRGYEALCDGDGTVADASDCWAAMLSAAPRVGDL